MERRAAIFRRFDGGAPAERGNGVIIVKLQKVRRRADKDGDQV